MWLEKIRLSCLLIKKLKKERKAISRDYSGCYKYTCIGNLKHLNYMGPVLRGYLAWMEFKARCLYLIYPQNTSLRVSVYRQNEAKS